MAQLVGILNITNDSFSDGGKYNNIDSAIEHMEHLFTCGADLVDIGAASTSYNRELISPQAEWKLLEPVINNSKHHISKLMIDTYNYQTAELAIKHGIKYINDVSFGRSIDMLKLITESQVKYILMHSLVIPANKNIRVYSLDQIIEDFTIQIDKCIEIGIKIENLIIDPGIGFGAGALHAFEIIKDPKQFKKFNIPIMIGHSRKSFFEQLTNYPPQERDLETVIISLYLRSKVNYLRVHNISMHSRAFNVQDKLT